LKILPDPPTTLTCPHDTHEDTCTAQTTSRLPHGQRRPPRNANKSAGRTGEDGAIVTRALKAEGWTVVRAHSVRQGEGDGFSIRKDGHGSFPAASIRRAAHRCGVCVQYSHQSCTVCSPIAGRSSRGQLERHWPGLVGILNLNGSMTKAGIVIVHLE